MLERRRQDNVVYYVSPVLAAAGAPHAFSTRLGGVSAAPFDSMNLGTLGSGEAGVQDALENIRANQRRLRAAIGCEGREACNVHQVHGAVVVTARPGEGFENGQRADAIVSDDPGRVVSVKYADCVPILLASPQGRAVAAVHAGWRGVIAGVLPAAVAKLAEVGGCRAGAVTAAIGPCIGLEQFEVGPEVLAAFVARFGADAPVRRVGEKGRVDLAEAVRRQLTEAGVPADRIDATDRCTFRDGDEFFSHRRDRGVTGRMAAFIGARGTP
jgi:polyphenol oxidase